MHQSDDAACAYCAGRRRTTLRTFWVPPLRKHSRRASRSPHYHSILNNNCHCNMVLHCTLSICSRRSFEFDGGSVGNFPSIRSHFGFGWVQVDIISISTLHIADHVYPPPPELDARKLYHARSRTQSLLIGILLATFAAYSVLFSSDLDAAVLARWPGRLECRKVIKIPCRPVIT